MFFTSFLFLLAKMMLNGDGVLYMFMLHRKIYSFFSFNFQMLFLYPPRKLEDVLYSIWAPTYF